MPNAPLSSNQVGTPETEFALKKQIARELDEVMKRAYPGERVGVMLAWWREVDPRNGKAMVDFTTNVQNKDVVTNVIRTLLARLLKGGAVKFHDVKVRD